MVESAAGLQLPGPQIEQGHLELTAAMQPLTLVACGGQRHRAHIPDQTHMQELTRGIESQELEQVIPHHGLPDVSRET